MPDGADLKLRSPRLRTLCENVMEKKLRVGIFDTEYYTYNHYILQGICAAFSRDPNVASARLVHFHTSFDEMLADELDLLVVVGNSANVHWQISRWRARGVTTVFWSTEDPYQLSDNVEHSRDFDLIFSNDLASLPIYGDHARHLPLAGVTDTHLCDVLPDDELRSDVLFIGSAWPNRVEAFNKMKAMLGDDVRIKVALPTNPHIPKPQINDGSIIWNWRTSPGGFARLANRSRVVLTLGRTFSGMTGVVYGSTPPPRIFELGLAGTAQVFVAQSREIDRYYEDGRDLITRPSLTEAVDEIKGLLADPSRRDAMARSMRETTLAHHCYDNRAAEIMEAARALRETQAQEAAALPAVTTQDRAPAPARRPRLLIVVHNTLDKGAYGGVEVYIDASLRLLQQQYDVYILQPENRNGSLVLELRRPDGISLRHETRLAFGADKISIPEIEAYLFQLILRHQIDLVHFHHLLNLPLRLPHVARLAGARTLYTAHDYYLVCDNFSLISYERRFCDFRNRSTAYCDLCLRLTKGRDIGTQSVRRNAVQHALFQLDKVVFNTPYSRDLFADTYRMGPDQAEIIEMAMPVEHFHVAGTKEREPEGDDDAPRVMKVKIPGNFTREKGAFEILEVLEMLRNDPIEFHILGREDDELAARLDAAGNPKIHRQRGYQQPDLAELLADGDVSINFSIWPETYMISLSEAWSAGLIPIVSDLGAPAERVTSGVDGFVIAATDIGRLAEHLRELAYDPEKRRMMRETILKKKIFRVSEHIEQLRGVYDALLAEAPPQPERKEELEGLIFDRQMYGDRAPNNAWIDPSVVWDADMNSANIHITNVSAPPFSYPITTLPIIYQHLPQIEIQNEASGPVVFESITQKEGYLSQLFYDVTYRIYPTGTLHNVQNFLRLETGEDNLVYALDKREEPNGSLLLSTTIPLIEGLRRMAILSVHDGQTWIYPNIEIPPQMQMADDDDIKDDALTGLVAGPETTYQLVQGCDRVTDIKVADGTLSLEGWAFDPLTGEIPATVMFELSDSTGDAVTLTAERRGDTSITRQEPTLGFTGVGAELRLDHMTGVLSGALPNLTVRILQKSRSGDWISSGSHIEAPLSSMVWDEDNREGRLRKKVSDTLHEALLLTLEKLGHDRGGSGPWAELLAWSVDPRLFIERMRNRGTTIPRNALIAYYISEGEALGDIPMIGFDPTIYACKNPELSDERPLLLHYLKFGRHEGRVAWDGNYVQSTEADKIRPYMHKDFYIKQVFGDVGFSGDIAMHYLTYGEENNFRPNEIFDPKYYREVNPDVARSGASLFVHYLNFGRDEGRRPSKGAALYSPHVNKRQISEPFFDTEYYIEQVGYIADTDIDPICHYFEHGIRNSLLPSPAYKAERASIPASSELERFMRWCVRNIDAGEQVE